MIIGLKIIYVNEVWTNPDKAAHNSLIRSRRENVHELDLGGG